MVNNLILNPVGVSKTVDFLQKKLYDKLTTLWATDLNGYPICFDGINKVGTKEIRHYTGVNEYISLISSEQQKFFFTNNYPIEQISDLMYSTYLDLFFIVDLSKIKPAITHRAKDETIADILSVINSTGYTYCIDNKIETREDYIFRNYEYPKTINMQPNLCLKFTIKINQFKIK